MNKTICILIFLFLLVVQGVAQTSDNKFQQPLQEVLMEIEEQFNVHLRYSEKDIEGKILTYAKWRFRPDFEQTMKNVLAPFDLSYLPDGAPDKFKIEEYRYHRRTVSDAKETLAGLAELYSNIDEWESRKNEIKPCLLNALRFDSMPEHLGSKPIVVNKRKHKGYTVENISLEVLPGVFTTGSVYKPLKVAGKIPVILCPNGHFANGRYNEQVQARCAGLALMGAVAVSYDLFAWGESALQFNPEYHRYSLANTIQALNSIRLLDYLLAQDYADPDRVGITGGSGGGSHSILISAIDERIDISVPAVMMSAIHYGGCPCESGNPIHFCGGGTNNVELAGLFAPKPQLIISDGGDWTANVPELEFPFLKRIYDFYGSNAIVENEHFQDEGHDYGPSKREAMYRFMARVLGLDSTAVIDKNNRLDESGITIEDENQLKVFGKNGENLPANALTSFIDLEAIFGIEHVYNTSKYKIGVCDWMILKRQKLGALQRTHEIGADGVLIDMGGLGSRPTFDSKLFDPVERRKFQDEIQKYNLQVAGIAMSGFYAQNFAERDIKPMITDCINTMMLMGTKVAFLPLGVDGDLIKHPERRDSIVTKLRWAGEQANAAGVVIGIETSLDANGELELLKEIGSPGIKIYYNFANALQNGRDLVSELQILGADNICQILCTNSDGVWLENDPAVDMVKVKETLDEMKYKGWLVIERSRNAGNPRDVVGNFGANTRYLKRIFQ
ncbi:MAG: TIM barrel protein [Prolixibacteraceae bacterium]|nr:TIM barrel protein [Prolixibacteraceae bacterium]